MLQLVMSIITKGSNVKAFGCILVSTIIATTTVNAKALETPKKSEAASAKKRKPASVTRPLQFVLLAFDGSKDNNFWEESFDAAKKIPTTGMNGKPSTAKFTYFVNPTYYTGAANKKNYVTPRLNRSVSCIGWASDDGTSNSIPLRMKNTNKAFVDGHEIGSHANSHCDQSGEDRDNPMYGKAWGQADWDSEFSQFNKLLFGTFSLNGVKPIDGTPGGFAFSKSDIKGFRAPLLAYTSGLWPVLKKYGFSYDTSKTNTPDYWPQRQSWGGWDIPLARIKIAGSSKTVIGMDYNWLCFHSACASKPGLTEADRIKMQTQVYDSYRYYFKKNYFGNRAPVQIGHHFSQWNKGIYWNAMKDFSRSVCSLPEVRCVTFAQYVNWLDGLGSETYQAYRKGDFQRLRDDGRIKDIATLVMADVRLDYNAEQFEAVVPESDRAKINALRWSPRVLVNFENQNEPVISRQRLLQKFPAGSQFTVRASLFDTNGSEMNWQTFKVENFGTEQESVTGPIEERALKGETSEAHGAHEEN